MVHRDSFLNSPIVAAAICAWGLEAKPDTLLEVMSMRDMDPHYFDCAYTLALAVMLASRLQENPSEVV